MSQLTYIKHSILSLKNHEALREKWVQERIAEDPGILGLGDVILRDKERPQPHAGRLDLLLQDTDSRKRYEVELQLGATDESHLIRTIEYWDIERKRYPQYDHCAVIVAEKITGRFLNVISLFNGAIPLIAIQMSAIQVGSNLLLQFVTVLDQVERGLVEEDEELVEVTDRAYWEGRGTPQTVALTDRILELIRQFSPDLELKYNKFYIGLAKQGQPNNFVEFRPQKKLTIVSPRLEQTDEQTKEIEDSGLDFMDYDKQWKRYRIRLAPDDLKKHEGILKALLQRAYEFSGK